ncbi:hypothetical protein GCM10010156_76060 [Planobispora rosea]|uniref:Uncharacterized protein n=1 Tax=Planobispora rosea TaxID=35762 RepID=Q2MLT6_PLARO|nr:hypothetical protein [Planobispora rosea]ABC59118.1 hypothetical protein pPR2.2c [Planobispora rosea]GGT07611.1 hypothetical protein GCM10010156_76060 [Planobispora rosea]GIH89212.1 hypothetical protein Pro02_76200 [Planobispora rosea]
MAFFRDLGDALYRGLTGGRSPASEGRTTQERAERLIKKHGSIKAAAADTGVSPETMRRWARGEQEAKNTARSNNADKLAAAERRARMTKAGTKRVRNSTGKEKGSGEGLRIRATVQVSGDRRERTIKPGEALPADAMESVITRFETEGPEAAALELQDLLDFYYFKGGRGHVEEITDIGY